LLIWLEKVNRLRAELLLAPPIVAAPTRSLPMAITGFTMRDAIAELFLFFISSVTVVTTAAIVVVDEVGRYGWCLGIGSNAKPITIDKRSF
jgi:hypothetical protein